jgi:hypothetical protein
LQSVTRLLRGYRRRNVPAGKNWSATGDPGSWQDQAAAHLDTSKNLGERGGI